MAVCNISQTQTHTDKQMTHKGNMTCRPRLINSLSQTNYCLGIATSGIWLESIKGTTTAKSDATDCQGIMDANGTDAQLPRRTYRNRFMSQTDCAQAKSRPAFTESAFSQWSEIMFIFWHVMFGIVSSQSGKNYIHAKVNMKDHLRPDSVLYFRSKCNRKAQWKLIL